jgi:tetratricopeptide (TPR) repeat protein
MRRSSAYIVVILLIVTALAGCRRSASDANQNTNIAEQTLSAYSDPNLALADGSKFLDEGEINKAIDALNQAVKLNPDLAEAWFKLGVAYALAEKRDENLEKETETSANDKKPSKPNSEKAFEKAVTAYKKLVDAHDQDDVAYFNLGRAYNKLNQDQDAAKALKQAVKIKPDDTEYQTELGAILIKLAQYQEAIAPLKKALEIDPDNIRAQELLEDAEAGRSRVNYSSTPKDEKKSNSNTSSSNSNSNSSLPPDRLPPPRTPEPDIVKPKPSPTRPE